MAEGLQFERFGHCEGRSGDAAISMMVIAGTRLLRCARNDGP
jgi:hypothetical protein